MATSMDLQKKGKEEEEPFCESIEIVDLTADTIIPTQIEKFWASCENKAALQVVSREFFKSMQSHKQIDLVLSGYVNTEHEQGDCVMYSKDNAAITQTQLTSNLEEADVRLTRHVNQAVIQGSFRIVVCFK